jgi:hypothetical protein
MDGRFCRIWAFGSRNQWSSTCANALQALFHHISLRADVVELSLRADYRFDPQFNRQMSF